MTALVAQANMRQGTAGEFPAHIAEFGLFPGNTLRRVEKFWRLVGDGAESASVDLLDSTTYGGEAGIRILKSGFSK